MLFLSWRSVAASVARSQPSLNLETAPHIQLRMSGEPDNLVLVYSRRIDGKIDRLPDDVQDLKHRVTSLRGHVASVRADLAAMSMRINRIETRLHRMERRLDIVPQPAG